MSIESLAYALLTGRPYFGMALRARQGLISRHPYFLPIVKESPGITKCWGWIISSCAASGPACRSSAPWQASSAWVRFSAESQS